MVTQHHQAWYPGNHTERPFHRHQGYNPLLAHSLLLLPDFNLHSTPSRPASGSQHALVIKQSKSLIVSKQCATYHSWLQALTTWCFLWQILPAHTLDLSFLLLPSRLIHLKIPTEVSSSPLQDNQGLGAGEMTSWIKCLPRKCENWSLNSRILTKASPVLGKHRQGAPCPARQTGIGEHRTQ